MEIQNIFTLVLGMAGLGAFISALVNIGKVAGIVKNNTAKTWVAGLNLLAVIVIYALQVKGLEFQVAQVDATFAQLAQITLLVAQLMVQYGGSALWHQLLKGVALVGKSFSAGTA